MPITKVVIRARWASGPFRPSRGPDALVRPVGRAAAERRVQLAPRSDPGQRGGQKLQIVQLGVMAGETVDDGERFQEYGFSSVPKAGAEAVVLFPNGDRGHPLVIAVDDRRFRPKGSPAGEVVL